MEPKDKDKEALDILRGFVEFIENGPGDVDDALQENINIARAWLDDQEVSL